MDTSKLGFIFILPIKLCDNMRLVFVQGASVLVDFCGRGWEANPPDDSHCLARAPWARPGGAGPWLGSGPLQLGGLAHARPRPEDHGWTQTPTATPLDGCISHLRIDGQVRTLPLPGGEGGGLNQLLNRSFAECQRARPQHGARGEGGGGEAHWPTVP